jgi:multidrug transporter EmrE-like cation transporter
MNLYLWFFIAAIAAAIPIPFIKRYTQTHSPVWILLSAISYGILILAYSIILTDKNITIVYPILKVLSVLIVIGAGLLLFSNRFDLNTAIGIGLGIGSIYILSQKLGE